MLQRVNDAVIAAINRPRTRRQASGMIRGDRTAAVAAPVVKLPSTVMSGWLNTRAVMNTPWS